MNKSKSIRYAELITKFKKHKFSDPKLLNPHEIAGFNFAVINPWELWHNNLDAQIMFIGQDFSDTASLRKNLENNWEKERIAVTNSKIIDFFNVLGYYFTEVTYNIEKTKYPLFFTNAVLGIKQSDLDDSKLEKLNMNKSVKESWHKESREYLKELIDIIEPQYIIVMGRVAYKSICKIYNLRPKKVMIEAINEPINLPNKTIFVVQHCSGLGQVSRPLKDQLNDWIIIRDRVNPHS